MGAVWGLRSPNDSRPLLVIPENPAFGVIKKFNIGERKNGNTTSCKTNCKVSKDKDRKSREGEASGPWAGHSRPAGSPARDPSHMKQEWVRNPAV